MQMPTFFKKTWFKIVSAVVVAGGIVTLAAIADVRWSFRDRMYSETNVPFKPVIMVLGAALKPDGTPSDALLDRLQVGLDLYEAHKGNQVLVTGDDGRYHTDEVRVMRDFYLTHGVNESDVLVDGQGYRTYESCSRAFKVLHIQEAIIVSQDFHLPRALYLCNRLGVQSVGASADLHRYKDDWYNEIRDLLASFKAWIDINIWKPQPPV